MGYLLYKIKIFNTEVNQKLTKLLLNVSMPALIISSVLEQTERPPVNEVLMVFAVAVAMYVVLPIISIILVKLMRVPKEQQGLYMFMNTFSNVGFMGFPIISALYGEKGVFYAAIINIIFNLSVFTYGIIMVHYASGEKANLSWKKLLSPGILCSLFAILVYALNIKLPTPVSDAVSTLGGLTTPLAMLIIGSTLATMDIKSVFNDGRVYVFSIIKQLILPILLFYVAKLLIHNEYILGITFIMLLMPVANTGLLFATEYGRDEKLAAKTVFITTVMSLITIPLGIWICM
jgi:hypothetical protein